MILGYSIFIVIGNLMECEADQLLNLVPAVQPVRPQLIADATGSKVRASAGGAAGGTAGGSQVDEEQLKKALKESKELNEHGDTSLQRALQMSMEGLFVVHYITKFFFVFIHFGVDIVIELYGLAKAKKSVSFLKNYQSISFYF